MLRSVVGKVAALAGASVAASAFSQDEHVYESGEAIGRGIKLQYWKAKHENVDILDLENDNINFSMTCVRNEQSQGKDFVHFVDKLLRLTLEYALLKLPNDDEAEVSTPSGYKVSGITLEDDVQVCGLSVSTTSFNSASLERALKDILPPDSSIGNIKLEKGGKKSKVATSSIPQDIGKSYVILLHPEFASYQDLKSSISLLTEHDVEEDHIIVVTLVTCPEATDEFCKAFPDCQLVTASYDAKSDDNGNIVPGIGGFEQRYSGIPSTIVKQTNLSKLESTSEESKGGWFSYFSRS